MLLVRKYRQWIAAILLAVYAFIAAPVQWWHHHAPVEQMNGHEKKLHQQFKAIAKAKSSPDDCAICAHKYSTYFHYSFIPDIAPFYFHAITQPDRCSSLYSSSPFHFSNKSPPVKA